MKWWSWIGVGILSGLVWVGVQMPDEDLHVIFCDVGQGDAVLVVKGSFQMVVDGGPNGERFMSCLGRYMPFWDGKIEIVVNTHPQKDHLGGLDDLVERYEVGRLVINGVFGGGKDGERLRELVAREDIDVVVPKEGDVLRLGSLQFDILWPEERMGSVLAWSSLEKTDLTSEMVLGKSTDVNEVSVVGVLRYGEFEVLLTGDIGEKEEKRLLSEGSLIEVDVLKVAHHGSRYSNSGKFLEMVSPKMAVIQVGKNSFGHPTKEVLERLEKVGAKVFRNDLDGDVEIVSDGQKYWIQH